MTYRAYLSLGSNAEPQKNIAAALTQLREQFDCGAQSPMYESRAVKKGQSTTDLTAPNYLNMVLVLNTAMAPAELREHLRRIEHAQGRGRDSDAARSSYNAAKKVMNVAKTVTLDLDLVFLRAAAPDNNGEPLFVHEDVLRYEHVLRPLADIAGAERLNPKQNIQDFLRERREHDDFVKSVIGVLPNPLVTDSPNPMALSSAKLSD